jgi:hypothetical protein
MADEAFALSPISARATLPSEEDYAAIAEAFMETSRGRWFLTEYAKRNRNADTRMVLDAVARIEQSLSAQREETLQREAALQREGLSAQQAAEAVLAAAAAQERLTEALAAIRGAVDAAEESAVEAIDSLALEQRLAPVRKGARVLREIAWRLREIGNDGRICDLIDSQVTVIERGTDQFSSEEARIALRAAFAALQGRLVEFADEPAPALDPEAASFPAMDELSTAETADAIWTPEAAEPPSAPVAAPTEAAPAAAEAVLIETETPPAAELSTETAVAEAAASQAPAPQAAVHEVAAQESSAQEVAVQDIAVQDDAVQDNTAESAAAQDEAVLDMIAMEMAAPDPINDEEIAEAATEQARSAEPAPDAAKIIAAAPESAPPPAPAMEVSLGSTLIANGLLRKPVMAANDPLAPIRRMSQAEKIAFFS